ncbi:MAG TPA: winged helix-turn-helix domain-containing protein [Steroidobacteraceae bacterium]|jgi:DNA-binding winged helix-turn-helix (wHTH) protein/Tol biopolymer transport system component|nr:winged helix-turn-helix domain-containing protein [Steroidobacteraceae bacterium]
MDASSTPDYEFGGFRLDTAGQTLISPQGEPIPLPYRAYQTLVFLVERAGELAEKSALMAAVWPRSVVEENNLSQCIFTLRKALGESAGERRFILTVPGRGFRFVAPVRVLPREERTFVPGIALAQDERVTARTRGPLVLAAGAMLLLVLIGAAWRLEARHPPITSPAEYVQLTDVDDSATAAALSPDGRMLAFIRGGSAFLSSGQIWLKVLPDGGSIPLTHTTDTIFAPTFTPDGTHVAYTGVENQGRAWDTWVAPITGGAPVRLLPNASGLTFIGPDEVMYSEFQTGIHLGIVTSKDDRSGHRQIYLPEHERGMAHFSYLSPDRRMVLVVEMAKTANFGRCRLVPFDASSRGKPVGPDGACLSAAWSPDGRWMYFAAVVAGHSHLWRQRYANGSPEQITFGPTEEQTVTVAADGHSLISSVVLGHEQSQIWLHDPSGERALTSEGYAFEPWLSPDAHRLYFLEALDSISASQLWRLDVASGRREALLSGFGVMHYDVSFDEQQVVFTTQGIGQSLLWIAPLDRHAPPRLLVRGGDEAYFDRAGRIYFRSVGEHANYLNRMNADGSGNVRLLSYPIDEMMGVAPDGRWIATAMSENNLLPQIYLVPTDAGAPRVLSHGWWSVRWSHDGNFLYVEAGKSDQSPVQGRTVVLPLDADGYPREQARPVPDDVIVLPHAEGSLSIGPDPSVYAFEKLDMRRNIYRIPLH